MADITPRLRAVFDLNVAEVREYSGRHEYDGEVQDLSPGGVRATLGRLSGARAAAASEQAPGGPAAAQLDDYDQAQLGVFERAAETKFGELAMHRRNPYLHIDNLDLACYDREYAPRLERDLARARHLAAWPQAVDAALSALDQVTAPVAAALTGAVRGLASGIPADADPQASAAARTAHARLAAHVERAAATGDPDAALGRDVLTRLMSSAEGTEVDLDRLADRADAERDRLSERLADSCARIDPGRPALEVARELVREHPDADGVIDAARHWTRRAISFTRDANLVPYPDGECLVTLAPESRRWAMAMMSSAAPGEPEGPSMYYITPPDPSWPDREAQEWLEVFSDTTLPGITVHEVAPGHFSHGRAIRRAGTDVRRTLHSSAFVEGWAHYAEEVCVEEGFCADDPRFAIGVWLEALVRVTRLACAIGLHTAGMDVTECARRFVSDTHLTGQAALAEARRATFDPTYGRYTWGKLEIMNLREQAKITWGTGFSLLRFHTALLDLGSPALGLLSTAVRHG
ncbi:MAG TPA: DUF885 family protein [Streptosporangiaceae bacterium]|nr:DUF885 family protein [Streptosporangiaceae bacterium]